MRGHRRLREFLKARRSGASIEVAAQVAEMSLREAELHDEVEQRGEYSDIVIHIEMPGAGYTVAGDSDLDPQLIERAKLTPQLRFKILHRDKFRCQSCGATPESGGLLQIDHIKPVARGGLTEWNNLQALCQTCNIGKGAFWEGVA